MSRSRTLSPEQWRFRFLATYLRRLSIEVQAVPKCLPAKGPPISGKRQNPQATGPAFEN